MELPWEVSTVTLLPLPSKTVHQKQGVSFPACCNKDMLSDTFSPLLLHEDLLTQHHTGGDLSSVSPVDTDTDKY